MSDAAPEPAPTIPAQLDDLEQRVAALETRFLEAVASEVAKVAGPVAADAVRSALEPYVVKIEELTGKLSGAADREAAGIDAFAHEKIRAVVSAVERAIGIKIPLPETPGAAAIGDVTVPGAETADQLSKG